MGGTSSGIGGECCGVGSAAVDGAGIGTAGGFVGIEVEYGTGDGRWKDVRGTTGVVVLELVVEVGCSGSGAGRGPETPTWLRRHEKRRVTELRPPVTAAAQGA